MFDCHTGSGFAKQDVSANNVDRRAYVGLVGLERTLYSRKASAPEGSYTKRLFEDANLLKQKLVEEAIELSQVPTSHFVIFDLEPI